MVDQKQLIDKAREMLLRDDVRRLIGWKRGTYGFCAKPVVLEDAADAEDLIFDPTCVHNLTTFITLEEKPPLPRGAEEDTRKIAVMVKGCDSRAIVQMLVEKAFDRDHVIVLGIPCTGVIDTRKMKEKFGDEKGPIEVAEKGDKLVLEIDGNKQEIPKEEVLMDKCKRCRYPNPLISDVLLTNEVEKFADDDFSDVGEFEKKNTEEKWQHFAEHFERCIRCYSCRNVCPLCYCEECVLTKLQPTWTRRANDISENTVYHIQRAWHLAGRCIECAECERVCPVDIPLMELNRKLTKDVKEMFDYEPGVDTEAMPLLASYNPQDPEELIM